ncbi:MAG: phosphoglucosamine mutase [Actinobacteria bacterium]|nr:phosphoglucosamine mutase [Actinomycetota bacterium]
MRNYFGTDGVRGKANRDLTPELALRLGRAVVRALGGSGRRVVVGRDTRISGQMLESALISGMLAEEAEVLLVNVVPTPAVAYLTEELEADIGAVISASHNPYEDNGIKFFSAGGLKMPDETEKAIEVEFEGLEVSEEGGPVGEATRIAGAERRYVDHLLGSVNFDLDGFKIALDCANGATYRVSPFAFESLGAKVETIGTEPDGYNINLECGSTHPERLAQLTTGMKADLGFALDGDGDRCMCVDETGEVRDGDYIMASVAKYLKERDLLEPPLIVTTVMSNLGLCRTLEELGIEYRQTQVGDRYVLEEMESTGAMVGGEQSGHIIFREHATTGDGTLTALLVAGMVKDTGRPLSELSRVMNKFPQVLVNVKSHSGRRLEPGMAVWETIRKYEEDLGKDGRIVVRSSGTEPVERVMVEAPSADKANEVARSIADAIARELDH